MATRSLAVRTQTPTATADAANLVDNTYPFVLQGGSGTQQIRVGELYLGGQGTASSPTYMQLGRDSTIAVTVGGGSNSLDAPIDPATVALAAPPITGNAFSGTKPQRSATLGGLLMPSFNAFGGLVRWVAPDEKSKIIVLGNTASFGELSLSAFSGGTPGALSAHLMYEPL